MLGNLGNKLRSQYERTGKIDDLEEAIAALRTAWECTSAVPLHRIRAVAHYLRLLSSRQLDAAADLGISIIDLISTIHTNLLYRGDQQFAISTFSVVATDLCSILLALDRLEGALYYLE